MSIFSNSKSSNKSLKSQMTQYKFRSTMLEALPDPVLSVDKDFTVTYINKAGASVLGKEPGDCINQKCYNLFHAHHCNTAECNVAKAMQHNEVFSGHTLAKPNGKAIPIQYTGTPLKDDEGNIIGALDYVFDLNRDSRGLTEEIAALVESVKQGNLSERADIKNYLGNDRKILEGINELMETFTSPFHTVMDYVNRISHGDIPEKITEEYNGDFAGIMNNLNTCIDAIDNLTSQSKNLVNSVVQGRLDIRSDEQLFEGDYLDIVSGMNNTVDTLKRHIDDIPAPVMIIDKNFEIQYMNNAGSGVIGRTQDQLIGEKCYDHFKTSDCKTSNCACGMAMVSGKSESSQTDAHPGGLDLIINYNAEPIKDQKGNVIGALEIVIDQTEMIKSMNDAEQKVGFLNKIPTPVIVVDKEFNIEFLNPAGAGALGRTVEDCIGQKCFNLFNTSHCNTSDCQCAKAMQKNGIFTSDTVAKLPSGNLPIRYTGAPLQDAEGNITGALEYVVDISKEMEITTGIGELVEAAINGQLSVRAEEDKFDGNYKKIIEGVNKTLDAVIAPLNVAAEYIDMISKGEMPDLIIEEYRGDFNKIKNNLNILIDAMINISDVSNKIADGDLTVTVEKRSEQDELMSALQKMIVELSRIALNIQESSEKVASSSDELSSSTQEMSQSATQQASSIEEVSSSMEEMNSSVAQNADNAKETASIAGKAAIDADEGGQSVLKTVEAMKSIADKIGIIEEIARQTNMLALNAAIEAARAGEHGKGFAVVADEVRNLAARSGDAAKEISELSTTSLEVAEKAGALIENIIPQIKRTSELVNEINASSSEQSNGIDQVTGAISELDKGLQQNSSAIEQMASTSEELATQAEEMREVAGFFSLNTGESGKIKRDFSETRNNATKRTNSTSHQNFNSDTEENYQSEKGIHIKMDDEKN